MKNKKEPIVYKESKKIKEVKQPALMDVEKDASNFNLKTKLSQLKISIPFNELLRNREYRDKITDMVWSQGEF